MPDYSLEDLRDLISTKDNQLLQLLKERMDIVVKIGEHKKQTSDSSSAYNIYYPAREAKILRHLLKETHNALPPSVIISIWRQIISVSCYLQSGHFSIGCFSSDESHALCHLLRYYFGHYSELTFYKNYDDLWSTSQKHVIFVMPSPESITNFEHYWWHHMPQNMHISSICPFVHNDIALDTDNTYFMLSRTPADPTGDDHSLVILSIKDFDFSVDFFCQWMESNNITGNILKEYSYQKKNYILIDFNAYIFNDDFKDKINQFNDENNHTIDDFRLLGHYASPIIL